MSVKNYIKESFKVRVDNKGSKEIWFQYRPNVPGDFLVDGMAKTPLGALYNVIINLNNTLRNANTSKPRIIDQVKIIHTFLMNYHFDIVSQEEYQRLKNNKRFVSWSCFIINKLELGNFLAPIPYRNFTLAICWNGVGPMEFRGRSTHDILRDFAITNRKLNTNLEGHRYGIAKFITNFKNLCSRYFGFDTWDDDAFLSCCIQAGLFNENEQREII